MATTSSKRILILGAPKSGKLTLLKELTGSLPSTLASASATVEEPASSITDPLTTTTASAPPAEDDDKTAETAETETDSLRPSHAGLSHNLHLKTKYYETHVPVWIDEYHHPPSSPSLSSPSSSAGIKDWATAFSSIEAQEVVDALGAIIVTFRKPTDAKQVADLRARMVREIEHVHGALVKQYKRKTAALEIKSAAAAGFEEEDEDEDDDEFDFIDFDGICLAVAVPSASQPSLSSATSAVELEAEDWEVAFQPFGFEFVDLEKSGRNDYGELLGLARIREALETYGWGDNEDGEARRRRDGYEAFDDDDFDDSEPVVARRGNGAGGKDEDGEEGDPEFDRELREMQMEMAALHFAIDGAAGGEDGDGEGGSEEGKGAIPDNDIEEIERIMQRMKEVRAQGDGLPLEERRKLADQLANDLLRLI
ncbi:hypothetical protein BZA70DRAFT_289350 [Myxozyma melibiosi]|uniref:Increased recombination centers protein 6 n=1 Tax=Myxozyma melibiosi TaxID=54550 RepID=A0ABR1F6F5_9ASCO